MSMSCGGQSSSLASGHERGGLREPGRIPEAGDFAPRLVTRAGAAVKAVETGWGEKKCAHRKEFSLRSVRCPQLARAPETFACARFDPKYIRCRLVPRPAFLLAPAIATLPFRRHFGGTSRRPTLFQNDHCVRICVLNSDASRGRPLSPPDRSSNVLRGCTTGEFKPSPVRDPRPGSGDHRYCRVGHQVRSEENEVAFSELLRQLPSVRSRVGPWSFRAMLSLPESARSALLLPVRPSCPRLAFMFLDWKCHCLRHRLFG